MSKRRRDTKPEVKRGADFWAFLEAAIKEVETWPAWKVGIDSRTPAYDQWEQRRKVAMNLRQSSDKRP